MNKITGIIKSAALLLSIVILPNIILADEIGDGLEAEGLFPKTFKPLEPAMASLGRYGTYQVNLSNGLPQISFNLFEVKSGSLSQPILLSYHGGGIKVSEEASWVGLGWDITWGGSITRVVYGNPDEDEDFANTPSALSIRNYMDANPTDIFNTEYDALAEGFSPSYMQDQYHFNCPGGSGMFIFDNTNLPMLVPHQPLSVNFSGIVKQIKAADQTSYMFEATDQTRVVTTKEIPYISSWGIKQIISRDGKDMIDYSYQTDGKVSNINSRFYDGYTFTVSQYQSISSRIGLQESTIATEVNAQKPKYIYFKDGKLEFVLSKRFDIGIGNTALNNTAIQKLERIIVYRKEINGSYTPEKHIQFYYSYFGTTIIPTTSNPALRLRLDRVTEKPVAGNEEKLIAAFQYHDGLPNKGSYSTDHWGYYNGATNNTPVVGFHMGFQYINGATKSVSESHMKAGSLNKITYPTGGSSVFNWEANDVYTDNIIVLGEQNNSFSIMENEIPGYVSLNHSTSGETLQKTLVINKTQTINLRYTLFKSSTSVEHKYDTGSLTIIEKDNPANIFTVNALIFSTQQTMPFNFTAGKTYYITIQANCNNVKGNLSFDYIQLAPSGNYQVGGLRIASIVNQDSGGGVVSTKNYSYTMPDNPNISSGYAKTNFSDVDYSLSAKQYSVVGYGGIQVLQTITKTLYYSDPIAGIYSSPVCYQYVTESDNSGIIDNGFTQHMFSVCQDLNPSKDIHISNEWLRGDLIQKKVFRNNASGSYQIVQQTDNLYSLHPNFSHQANGFKMYRLANLSGSFAGWVNTIVLNQLYEPLNFYYESAWKHLDSTIVKNYYEGKEVVQRTQYSYNNSVHCKPSQVSYLLPGKIKSIFNTYHGNTGLISNRQEKLDNLIIKQENISYNGNLLPLVYKEISSDQTDFNKYTYIYDSQKNMVEFTKENDISTALIWGYNQTYPSAKFDNITYSAVSSNSTLMNYVNQLQNYTVLTDPVVRNNLKALNTNIQNNLPANVWVTTYTYSPLIGLTSQTDANGVTTYYEYDSFWRLKNVKDKDQNILKYNQYHYKNQP